LAAAIVSSNQVSSPAFTEVSGPLESRGIEFNRDSRCDQGWLAPRDSGSGHTRGTARRAGRQPVTRTRVVLASPAWASTGCRRARCRRWRRTFTGRSPRSGRGR
jgi:hypothetical protein